MLEVRLIGKFEIKYDGKPVIISSRAAQSIFAYLILNAGTSYRREKLAGMFWPDATEEKARAYLRHELWSIRKALPSNEFLLSDDLNITFDSSADYWLDRDVLEKLAEAASADELIAALVVYHGEFLPGFYDDWIIIEREHLQSVYEQQMARLLELLESEKRWHETLKWAEQWISLGEAPETAYRYLMTAYDALGDRAKIASTYERCVQALRALDLEPSEETHSLALKRTSKLNIPIPLTSFVGREKELKEVADLFSKFRLVTLTGSGGVGKTRLAIQVVADVMEGFPDGVWFLDLAPLSDPALLPNTLANVLGLRDSGELPITEVLINYFRSRTALVIFDNCEHLIESCAQLIHSLLTSCQNLSILATSREALRISGEVPYRVPSLEIPKPTVEISIDEISNMESLRLFIERAAVASPSFAVSQQNVLAIAQICQRLDGIPLAIELAVARTNLLTVEQISNRLDDRFNLLTDGLRSALPRHQTLRATIEWSYDLLSERERILFRRLAVFMGGWTLDAVEKVCTGSSIISSEVLELLFQLVNKSLVTAEASQNGSRYKMLETIRQYANEKLGESGESHVFQNRHLGYFLNLAETAEPHLLGPKQLEWLARLDADYENLRAALEWVLSKDVPELSLRLCAALGIFWRIRSYFLEGSKWLKSALSKHSQNPEAAETRARVRVLYQDAHLAIAMDEIEHSTTSANLSLALASDGTDRRDIAIARFYVGLALDWRHKGDVAAPLMEQSLVEFQELKDSYWEAFSFRHLSYLLQMQGKLKRGEWTAQALELARKAGERLNLADALWDYSILFRHTDRIDEGMKYVEEADMLYQQIGSRINWTPAAFAVIAWLKGDYEKARAKWTEMRESLELLGERNSRSVMVANLGILAAEEGDLNQARIYLEEALATAQVLGNQDFVARRLIQLGNVYYLAGNVGAFKQNYRQSYVLVKDLDPSAKIDFLLFVLDPICSQKAENTAWLLGAIDNFERESEESIFPVWKRYYCRAGTHARETLGEIAFETAFAAGQKMSLDEALDLALKTVEEM